MLLPYRCAADCFGLSPNLANGGRTRHKRILQADLGGRPHAGWHAGSGEVERQRRTPGAAPAAGGQPALGDSHLRLAGCCPGGGGPHQGPQSHRAPRLHRQACKQQVMHPLSKAWLRSKGRGPQTSQYSTEKKRLCRGPLTRCCSCCSAAETRVVLDGNLLTSRGPGTAFEFALALVEALYDAQTAKEVAGPMVMPST